MALLDRDYMEMTIFGTICPLRGLKTAHERIHDNGTGVAGSSGAPHRVIATTERMLPHPNRQLCVVDECYHFAWHLPKSCRSLLMKMILAVWFSHLSYERASVKLS